MFKFVSIISLSFVLFWGLSYQEQNINFKANNLADITKMAVNDLNLTKLEGIWYIVYTKNQIIELTHNVCPYMDIKAGNNFINITQTLGNNTLWQKLVQNSVEKGKFEDEIHFNSDISKSYVFVLGDDPYLVLYQIFDDKKQPDYWTILKRKVIASPGVTEMKITVALKKLIDAKIFDLDDSTIGRYCSS